MRGLSLLLVAVLVASPVACGDDSPDGDRRGAAGDAGDAGISRDTSPPDADGPVADVDSPAADADSPAGADSSAARAAADSPATDRPFAGFDLEVPGSDSVTHRMELVLVNEGATPAVVFADGGAGEVLLDTVPPGTTARVQVLTRARMLNIRSVGPDGGELRRTQARVPAPTAVQIMVARRNPAP